MKKIRFSDNVQTKIIDYEEGEEFEEYRPTFDDEEEIVEVESEEKKWERYNKWPNLFCCIFYLSSLGNCSSVFPKTSYMANFFSGGTYFALNLTITVFVVLPLMYLEVFLGMYARKANSEMFRMAPISFGVGIMIFVTNVIYIVVKMMESTVFFTSMVWRVANNNLWVNCPPEDSEICYNYKIRGPLVNDDCTYSGYMSIVCKGAGEIRYPFEYKYWMEFRNTDYQGFEEWQIFICYLIMWLLVFMLLTRRFVALCKIFVIALCFKFFLFTTIFLFTTKDSGKVSERLAFSLEQLDVRQIYAALFFSIYKIGLVVPYGYMTHSTYVKHSHYISMEVFAIVLLSQVTTTFELAISQTISSSLGAAIGVPASTVFIPSMGYYVAFLPEFLEYTEFPHELVYLYYIIITMMMALESTMNIKMLILNFYGYYPKMIKRDALIRLSVCGLLLLLGTPVIAQDVHVYWIPIFNAQLLTTTIAFLVANKMTVVSYIYGVRRLCDDIYFLTGHPPMQFLRLSWILSPIIYWVGFGLLVSRDKPVVTESTTPINETYYTVKTVVSYLEMFLFFIGVTASIGYVFSVLGTEHMVKNLFRPQFYWGPIDKEERMKRKLFTPSTAVRSQPPHRRAMKEKRHSRKKEKEPEPPKRPEFYDVMIQKGRIFSDTKFFKNIGVTRDRGDLLTMRGPAVNETDEMLNVI